ncbi:zf-U1-domain-containing protein, partial [Patellaria atrata CBS 101060]
MPKFFCDYCDVYLTHDSMSVRKAHNSGRNHLRNVVEYYQQIGHEKAQSVIDSITSSYAAAGQSESNPMLNPPPGGPGAFPPPPFGFPGTFPLPPSHPPTNQTQAGIPPPFLPPGGRGMPPNLPFPP